MHLYAPPATELHRHLDLSTRLPTLLEHAVEDGLVPSSTSLDAFRERVVIRRPLGSLGDVLERFTIFQRLLDRPGRVERTGYEALLDCRDEGLAQVELRFSPSWVCEDGSLTWSEALDSFERGLERASAEAPEVAWGLLCIASRDYGPEAAAETAEFYLRHRRRFVGFDLAGDEARWPARLFEGAVAPILRARRDDPDLHVTIHAGEGSGPESVWEALELLGAERIGHGVRSFEDPALVRRLAEEGVCLEMCPTSNVLTEAVPSIEGHTLRRALEAGVPVCVNTDDPAIFGVTFGGELRRARDEIGVGDEGVRRCLEAAAAASFLGRA